MIDLTDLGSFPSQTLMAQLYPKCSWSKECFQAAGLVQAKNTSQAQGNLSTPIWTAYADRHDPKGCDLYHTFLHYVQAKSLCACRNLEQLREISLGA